MDEDYIAKKAEKALSLYRKTHDFEYLVELYYCTIALIGEDCKFDITLEEFLNKEFNLFVVNKN